MTKYSKESIDINTGILFDIIYTAQTTKTDKNGKNR